MNIQEMRKRIHEIIKRHAAGLGCENLCAGGGSDDQCENCQLLVDDIVEALFEDNWVRLPCKIGDRVYIVSNAQWKEPQAIKVEHIRYIDYGDNVSIYVEEISGYGGVIGRTAFPTLEEAKNPPTSPWASRQ